MKSLGRHHFIFAIFISLNLSGTVRAEADEDRSRDCFQTHLKSAIKTNRERRDQYADLTKGKSKKISQILIFVEKVGLSMAKRYDKLTLPYQERGMTVLCDELLSHRPIPEFEAHVEPTGHVPLKFISGGGISLTMELNKALKKKGFSEVARITQEKLTELETRPSFNCLLRNDLTTILKASTLAPAHIARAKELGLPSTEKIYRKFLKSVINILPFVDGIDKVAFPMQKKGVAIVCQDFPESRPL